MLPRTADPSLAGKSHARALAVPRSLVMTALCTHRRALKTAPIEFSDSTTEKDCDCIRNNGEWRCSRPIGVNFSKHITRSHGRSSNPNSTQSAQRRRVHREKVWAQKPQGPATSFVVACAFAPVAGALGYKGPAGLIRSARISIIAPE